MKPPAIKLHHDDGDANGYGTTTATVEGSEEGDDRCEATTGEDADHAVVEIQSVAPPIRPHTRKEGVADISWGSLSGLDVGRHLPAQNLAALPELKRKSVVAGDGIRHPLQFVGTEALAYLRVNGRGIVGHPHEAFCFGDEAFF